MFIPSAFVETDLIWLDRLLARDAFVTLVTNGADGYPQATRLPVVYTRDAGGILIEGHWAKPNPQAGHAGPALMLVHGPHAYVSPGWYPDKAAQARVPTWNYAAAELRGVLEPVTDDEALIAMLDGCRSSRANSVCLAASSASVSARRKCRSNSSSARTIPRPTRPA